MLHGEASFAPTPRSAAGILLLGSPRQRTVRAVYSRALGAPTAPSSTEETFGTQKASFGRFISSQIQHRSHIGNARLAAKSLQRTGSKWRHAPSHR